MAHDHHHGEATPEYFIEQLLTIFVAGLFGFAGIMMYLNGRLNYILAEPFRLPVLIGGVGVLVIVFIRGLSLWQEAGANRAHNHSHKPHQHGPDCDHGHGVDCGHDHGHNHDHDHGHNHDHSHDHDHDHDHTAEDHGHSQDLAWVFARMLVLFFPVALFLIGIPNSGFSQDKINRLLGTDDQIPDEVGTAVVAYGEGKAMSFNDLNDAAYDEGKRGVLQGDVGVLEGRFRKVGEKQFTLYRLKMTCCAADIVPLKVRILTPTALSGFQDGEWVQVKGVVQFRQVPGSIQFIPVVAVADTNDIKRVPAKE